MRRTLLTAAAALAIAAALSSAIVGAEKSRYDALLKRPAGQRKLAALAEMEHAARIDRPAFEKLMADKDALVRVRCAEVLGRVGDPSGVHVLARLAADKDLRVAETAVYSLGLLRDTTAIAPLARVLAGGNENLRLRALEALGITGKKQAALAILPYLRHFKSEVRAQAAIALAFAGDSTAAFDCQAAIQDDDPRVAASAAYAMGRLGYKAGRDLIEELLASGDAGARLRAVEALGRLKTKSSVPLIAALLQDADRWVAIKAAEALRRIESGGGADALAALLSSNDVYIKTAALEALAATAGKGQYPFIEPLLADASPMVRRTALGAAAKADPDAARARLLEAIEKGSPPERSTALELLGSLGEKEDLPLLCGKLLSRESGYLLAEGAAAGLGRWEKTKDLDKPCGDPDAANGGMTPLAALLAAAKGEDWVVASIAIESLGKVASPDIIPDLAAIYAGRPSRIEGDRRLAAVEAIRSLSTKLDEERIAALGLPAFLAKAHGDTDARVAAAAKTAAAALASRVAIPLPARSGAAGDRGAYPWGAPSTPIGNRRILVTTARGEIEILLYGDDAPNGVRSILTLAGRGFYKGQVFHRIVPGFVIQGGCPRGDGWADAGYYLRNEVNLFHYRRGAVGLADSGKDTAGSQFFIMHTEHPHLDGRYTIVGRVTRGMNVVDSIEEGDAFDIKVLE